MEGAQQSSHRVIKFFSLMAVLFALLSVAHHGTEFLKQWVLVPNSVAMQGASADCREDELEEEGLSLRECELMVTAVEIQLLSSPWWFRNFQLSLSAAGVFLSLFSVVAGQKVYRRTTRAIQLTALSIASLLLIDFLGFSAALFTGPLLRSVYLWPIVLWFFIHLCLLLAGWQLHKAQQSSPE